MKKLLTILTGALVASGLLIASGELVEPKPFNASILPDIAVYDRNERIEGLTPVSYTHLTLPTILRV